MEVLALSGSLRNKSYNTALLNAAMGLAPSAVKISLFDALGEIPHFSPDLDAPAVPASVLKLREAIGHADAVIISTPEYAHGIPGVLKNALDWLVSSGEIILKPIAVMSVSTSELGGFRAQADLIKVLHAMNTSVVIEASLAVPFAKTSFDSDGKLVDVNARQALQQSLAKVVQLVEQRKRENG